MCLMVKSDDVTCRPLSADGAVNAPLANQHSMLLRRRVSAETSPLLSLPVASQATQQDSHAQLLQQCTDKIRPSAPAIFPNLLHQNSYLQTGRPDYFGLARTFQYAR